MSRSIGRIVATTTISISLAGVGVTAANATVLYSEANYTGGTFGADNAPNVGGMNDQATSIKNFNMGVTFYENAGYLGRNFRTANDFNDLTALATGLNFGETWNDRISSYQR